MTSSQMSKKLVAALQIIVIKGLMEVEISTLTHMFPMYPFSTPWKYQETLQFLGIFRG